MGIRRSAKTGTQHAILRDLSFDQVLDELPTALLILDQNGAIVHRNQQAHALLAKVTSERGEGVIGKLREGLERIVRQAVKFPYTELIEVTDGRRNASAEMVVNRIPQGFLASWRDVTSERDHVRSLAQTADQLSRAAASFTTLGDQIADDADRSAERAAAVAAGAEQLSASIREISSSTATAASTTGTAVAAATAANEHIAKLGASSARIGEVSKLINAIAEQTNLLALNATIEAARAGEAGRGFAVVAGEVKDLAGRTSEATGQIAKMIEAIQSDSGDAATTIQRIVDLIGQVEQEQTTIASAVEEQTTTAAEMSASGNAVAGAAESSARVIDDLREAITSIATQAEQLRQLV